VCGMKLIRRKYDKSYSENILYKELPDSQRNKTRLTEVIKHKQGGRLLEVGCSKGGFLRMAIKHFDAEGIDISQHVVDTLKPTLGCRIQALNIESAELAPDHYDIIAAFNVFEHLREPRPVVEKMYTSLKEDGILIGSVPNKCGPVGSVVTALGNLMDRTHCSTYSPDTWGRLFRQVRFAEIVLFGEVNLGKNLCLYVKNTLWRYVSTNLMFVCIK